MRRSLMVAAVATLGLAIAASSSDRSLAQQSTLQTVAATPAPKAGKGEKVCRVKLKYSGEVKTWVCKAQEPCCVWHEINYVKCGSTITGCL
jgi:hypothetical protein